MSPLEIAGLVMTALFLSMVVGFTVDVVWDSITTARKAREKK